VLLNFKFKFVIYAVYIRFQSLQNKSLYSVRIFWR